MTKIFKLKPPMYESKLYTKVVEVTSALVATKVNFSLTIK